MEAEQPTWMAELASQRRAQFERQRALEAQEAQQTAEAQRREALATLVSRMALAPTTVRPGQLVSTVARTPAGATTVTRNPFNIVLAAAPSRAPTVVHLPTGLANGPEGGASTAAAATEQAAFNRAAEQLEVLRTWIQGGLATQARRAVPGIAPCPNASEIEDVPAQFVFRVVGADDLVTRCVDARLLDHLQRIGGIETLDRALTYTVVEGILRSEGTPQDVIDPQIILDTWNSTQWTPDQVAAIQRTVDNDASRFVSRWRQIDPARGIENMPGNPDYAQVDPLLFTPAGIPRSETAEAWKADPAGQRLRYTMERGPEPSDNVMRAIGRGEWPILLSPDLFGHWQQALLYGPAVPVEPTYAPTARELHPLPSARPGTVGYAREAAAATQAAIREANAAGRRHAQEQLVGPLKRITFSQPLGTGRLVRVLATPLESLASTTGTQQQRPGVRRFTDIFGTTFSLSANAIVEEVDAQPFVGLSIYSTDPGLPHVAYGYADVSPTPLRGPDQIQVPYDVLWRVWDGQVSQPPSREETRARLPPPLAAAASQVKPPPSPRDVVVKPSLFPLGAGIVLAPVAGDAAEVFALYRQALIATAREEGSVTRLPQSNPLERFLDTMRILVEGQILLVPPEIWLPARVEGPVGFVVRRLFGYIRRAPYSPGAFMVGRTAVATITPSLYVLDMEPIADSAVPTTYEALADYYAAGPNALYSAMQRNEAPQGDTAEATSIENTLRERTAADVRTLAGGARGELATALTAALPLPEEAIALMGPPTLFERAHWGQFMRSVAKLAGGVLPTPPARSERPMPGLHIEPLPTYAPGTATRLVERTPVASAGAANLRPILTERVLRYDTVRGVWVDVTLGRNALPALTDDQLVDLLLAPSPPGTNEPRAFRFTFYLMNGRAEPVQPASLVRSVTFAPSVTGGGPTEAERAEARQAQERVRRQSRIPTVAAAAAAAPVEAPIYSVGQRRPAPSPAVSPTTSPVPATTVPSPEAVAQAGGGGVPRRSLARGQASRAFLIESGVPDEVASLLGITPQQVRAVLASNAWDQYISGNTAPLAVLPAVPRTPQSDVLSGAAPSALSVIDYVVYTLLGIDSNQVVEITRDTRNDPRWGQRPLGERDVMSVLAAEFYPVVIAQTEAADTPAAQLVLEHARDVAMRQPSLSPV